MRLISFLFGSNKRNKTTKSNNIELEEITSRLDPKEGWGDVFLKITKDLKTETSHIYIAKGLYKKRTVGLQIEVSSQIGAGIIQGKPNSQGGFVSNAVRIKSIGQESDEFVKALADIYNYPIDKNFTKQTILATVFSLNEKVVDLDKSDYYQLKLFFAENDEHLYSEVFLNINTEKREIEINEKDADYREPIIKLWTN